MKKVKKIVMFKDKPYGVMIDENGYITGIYIDLDKARVGAK